MYTITIRYGSYYKELTDPASAPVAVYFQDVVRKISKKKGVYKTEKGALKKLNQLIGEAPSPESTVSSTLYGEKKCTGAFPGKKDGFVDVEYTLYEAKKRGKGYIDALDLYSPMSGQMRCLAGITIEVAYTA